MFILKRVRMFHWHSSSYLLLDKKLRQGLEFFVLTKLNKYAELNLKNIINLYKNIQQQRHGLWIRFKFNFPTPNFRDIFFCFRRKSLASILKLNRIHHLRQCIALFAVAEGGCCLISDDLSCSCKYYKTILNLINNSEAYLRTTLNSIACKF